jgi:hypothetical protein
LPQEMIHILIRLLGKVDLDHQAGLLNPIPIEFSPAII